MKHKKFIVDSVLNLIAYAIPVFILHFLVMPYVNYRLNNSELYGVLIAIVALMNIFSHTFGNVLNNIRLIFDHKYKELDYEGDFNILVVVSSLITMVIMFFGTWYYEGGFEFVSISLVVITSVFRLMNDYYSVSFRLVLNYKAILLNNIMMVIGYGIGTYLFIVIGYWQLIYFCGSLLSLIYVFNHSKLQTEKLARTPLFFHLSKDSVVLLVARLITNTITQADKLILFPILGAEWVSIYYAANIFTKAISLVMTPFSNVMLSYISRIKKKPKKAFFYSLIGGSIFSLVAYILCIIMAKPILAIIYPKYMEEALKLVYITSATASISSLQRIIASFVLRFSKMRWQLIINGTYLFVYLIVSFALLNLYGIMGLAIGVLISHIYQASIMIHIYLNNFDLDTIAGKSEML